MSRRPFVEFAGVTEASRVRKPPGGDTHDIFGLEIRQKCPASQVHFNDEIKTTKTVDQEHDIPAAGGIDYAGVTDKTRVRKPPGGNTNDIFDLESRQRSQAMDNKFNSMSLKNVHQGRSQTGIGSSNIMNQEAPRPTTSQLKRGQFNANQFDQLFHQVDKENMNLLSEAYTDEKKQDSFDEDDHSNQPAKKYLIHNPITGEVSEMKVSNIYKMADCSNVTSSSDLVEKPEVNKPSVRVRQPPGGASSHIF